MGFFLGGLFFVCLFGLFLKDHQKDTAELLFFSIPLSGKQQTLTYTPGWSDALLLKHQFSSIQLISKGATQQKPTDCAGELQITVTEKLLLSSICKLACSEERGWSLLLLALLNGTHSGRNWDLQEGKTFQRGQGRAANAQMPSHHLSFWEQETVQGIC